MAKLVRSRSIRPCIAALAIVILIAAIDVTHGRFLSIGTASIVLQQFATVAPVALALALALALGLTMILREFDLSVGGMTGLAGCIAVLAGGQSPLMGLIAAALAGKLAGGLQGFIMIRLRLSSVAVTLGGLLTLSGLTYVITGNTAIGYPRIDVAMLMNAPLVGIVSIRSVVAIPPTSSTAATSFCRPCATADC
jgi:ribose/xylose/arabinose/galactoside ABC-type transport system permease subunit